MFESDETIAVITNQPQSVLETYDNVPTVTQRDSQSFDHLESSATFEIYNSSILSEPKSNLNQSESRTDFSQSEMSSDFNQSLPSDYMVSSYNASTPAKSFDYSQEQSLNDSIKTEETSVYVEPSGESSDYRTSVNKTVETDISVSEDTGALNQVCQDFSGITQ